ncbi:MAG TPA: S41 family peptidase, partial [Chitinophagaceae bacterium]|nr:S41 family peptidase [Chitinophagaceae bacterium]
MRATFLLLLFIASSLFLSAQELTHQQYKEDFNFFWQTIKDNYGYWDKKQTDWQKVKEFYQPQVDTVSSRGSFVLLLEKVFNELYDHHASLNTNTRESQRLVPSGTDIWAEYINDKPIVTEVRIGFGAEAAGLKAGMEIIAFNDVPIEKAILPFLPTSSRKNDKAARDYALRVLVAGKAVDDRKIRIKSGNVIQDIFPDRPINLLLKHQYKSEIESRTIRNAIGYIRINNQLGNNYLIPIFDSVLRSMHHTKALILDLRETPSGGNTTVARAILGIFIRKDGFYQKHELPAEETAYGIKRSWEEIVSPRAVNYDKPLVVLVNHWTGSVSEGITIGFDALKRATIIGTRMAGLNGAIYSYQMPHSKIRFSFPVEKLFH